MQHPSAMKSWQFRVVFALVFSPGIGMLVGLIVAHDVTGFEGASGYAWLYGTLIGTPIALLALALTRPPLLQLACAIAGAAGYVLSLM